MLVRSMLQDRRVETYLQSQEEEGTDILANIQTWGYGATATLQRLVQRAVPARPTLDEYEEVGLTDSFCICHM